MSFETYRAKDVDEAIELAVRLRDQKGYDMFRGQIRSEWKPYTSLMRLLLQDPDALEILLDQFFDKERTLAGAKHFKEIFEEFRKSNPGAHWTEMDSPKEGYRPEYVRDGSLYSHPSWEITPLWLTLANESHEEVWSRDNPLTIDFSLPAIEIARRIANGSRRAMDRDPTLRDHLINWRLEPPPSKYSFRPALVRGLNLLWDGLRKLPLANTEIATALGNWVALYSLEFDVAENYEKQEDIFASLLGESIYVEFGAEDGSSSRGFASVALLREALRPDLEEILTDESKKRAEDLEFLLQIIFSPNRLFEFRKFASLFATQIAPSQLVRSEPHFFHQHD